METFYIYISRFDLSNPHEQVLSFKQGDRFVPISSRSNNPNWAFCVNIKGKMGYIPYTYVKQQPISKEELTGFIDIVLETLEKDCRGSYTKLQRDVIQELSTWRTLLLSPLHSPDDAAKFKDLNTCNFYTAAKGISPNLSNDKPPDSHHTQNNEPSTPLLQSEKTSSKKSPKECAIVQQPTSAKCTLNPKTTKNAQTQYLVDQACVGTETVVTEMSDKMCQSSIQVNDVQEDVKKASSDVKVPLWLIPSLIENVRHATQLSHQNCKVAVSVVLDTLCSAVPNVGSLWNQLKQNLDMFEVIQEETENVIISEDRKKLFNIFKQLWYCKNDEQQRSWPVHEDEALIESLLTDLNTILMDADPKVTKEIIQRDDYELINLLVTYYQMEPRRILRVKLLLVFVTLCELNVVVVSQLLLSILPMELVRDMKCTFDDREKVQYSAFVLTIIFSTGQKPPNAIYEFVDHQFLSFVFENVEISLRNGDESVGNHLLNVLLAFNLHFDDIHNNHVMTCLKDRDDVRMLTEKLIFYVNREDDPINILGHKSDAPNSVLKFLVDFFAFPELVHAVYLNDIKLILDITVRQLTDYLPGESKRMWYLRLVKNILQNSSYEEHFHQQEDLQKCFYTVMAQEEPCPSEEAFVQGILNQFPDWFNEDSTQ